MQNPALRPSRQRLERPSSARFRSECRGSICILHVTGVVDAVNAAELDVAIARIASEHRGDVLVSFVHCDLADGFALRVLLTQVEALGSRLLVVADLAGRLPRLLAMTSTTARLHVYATLRAAFYDLSSDPTRSLGDLRAWAPRSA
jgi:anti-anti-sigma factor